VHESRKVPGHKRKLSQSPMREGEIVIKAIKNAREERGGLSNKLIPTVST